MPIIWPNISLSWLQKKEFMVRTNSSTKEMCSLTGGRGQLRTFNMLLKSNFNTRGKKKKKKYSVFYQKKTKKKKKNYSVSNPNETEEK